MVSMDIFAAPAVKYPESSYFVHSVKLNQYELVGYPGGVEKCIIVASSKARSNLQEQQPFLWRSYKREQTGKYLKAGGSREIECKDT